MTEVLGGSGTCESFETGDRLGCSTTKSVSLAECIRMVLQRDLVWGIIRGPYITPFSILLEDKATACLFILI